MKLEKKKKRIRKKETAPALTEMGAPHTTNVRKLGLVKNKGDLWET